MSVQIKFCGMMRELDVEAALNAGGSFVGVIMAGGPRSLSRARAIEVLKSAEGRAKRVAVISAQDVESTARAAEGFDVAQLHGDATPEFVTELRRSFDGDIWPVVRSTSGEVPDYLAQLYETSDAVLFDKKSVSGLGGTGISLDWDSLNASIGRLRQGITVLAGGLTPANVGEAIRSFRPDIVDVSSGVENAPGVKDHKIMQKFADAVSAAVITDA